MQTETSLLLRNPSDYGLNRGHSVCTMLKNSYNRPINVRQGPAVLAAGTGWKVFDFLWHFLKTLTGIFCEEMKR